MSVAADFTAHEARQAAANSARAARTRLLLEGPVGRTLTKLAAPNVLAMLVAAAMNIAEGAFAGMLGVTSLAGLALVYPLVMLVQMLSGGSIGGAISSAVARALGAGDPERAGRLAVAAWVIAAVIALVFGMLVLWFGRAMFLALGGSEAVVNEAMSYAAVYFPGCATVWIAYASTSVIRGTGNMMTPSVLLLLASVLSIPLAGGLALGWGPLPALGMAGLATGQITAFGLIAIMAVGYLLAGRAGLLPTVRGLAGDHFAAILRVGVVASLSAIQTVVTIVAMTALIGRFGAAALAGYGLGARLEFIMVPVVFGVGAAMTAMVGANIGAGQAARAKRIAWTGTAAAAVIVGAIGMFFAAFPDVWLRLFLAAQDEAALETGRLYFRTVAPFYCFFAAGLALYFASQGAGRVAWPVSAGFVRMFVAIGGGYLLAQSMEPGLPGVLVAIAGGMVAYGLVTIYGTWRTRWG